MSQLVEHAKRELEIANVDEDVRPSIIAAVEAFVTYGHSGGSAPVVIYILNELLSFRNISPLTDNPKDWMLITDGFGDGKPVWQSRRRSDAFSNDGGKTYYCLDEDRKRDWLLRKRFIMHRSESYGIGE